jgi:ribonuclease J
MVLVDGFQMGDEDHIVLRDRQQVSADGILIAVVTVNSQTGDMVNEPELVARGFLYDEEGEQDLLDLARDHLVARLQETAPHHVTGQRILTDDVHDALASFIYKKTKREPLVLPVILEV